MKRGTTKIVAAIAIGILLTAAVVLATIFLTRDRNEEATFADGAYQGYYIWCEKTDGTVTDTHNMGVALPIHTNGSFIVAPPLLPVRRQQPIN